MRLNRSVRVGIYSTYKYGRVLEGYGSVVMVQCLQTGLGGLLELMSNIIKF